MSCTKRYISFQFDDEFFWIEFDSNGYATRQIISNKNGRVQVSCFEDCLAEGKITELVENIEDNFVEQSDFNEAWRMYTKNYRNEWLEWKNTLKLGDTLTGEILYHYPQGWILAVCGRLAVFKSDGNFQIGQSVKGKIDGFDEENMWVELV